MTKRNKILLILFLAVDSALAAFAFWLIFMPQANLPNFALLNPKGVIAQKERALIFTAVGLMLAVVLPTFGFIIFLIKKNKTKKKPSDEKSNQKDSLATEVVLWAIPILLIFIISIINWKSTHDLDPYKPLESNVKPLTIQVVALPWKWLFIYPEQNIATINFIEFPKDTPVNFQLTADAPMSVFWIPQLGGQVYAMAGMSTQLKLMSNQYGEFNGSAAEINGAGFAGMRFVAKSASQDEFNAWLKSVQSSSNPLSFDAYKELAKPSENNPKVFYSSVEPALFNKVMMQFMAPASPASQGGSALPGATTKQMEGMQ